MNHTKGPWRAVGNKIVAMDYGGTPGLDMTIGVANHAGSMGNEEGLANARLMAAALDLLAVVKRAARRTPAHRQYPGGPSPPDGCTCLSCVARAAIAKIEEGG